MKASQSKVQFLSDFDPDYRLIEKWLKDGEFGELKDLESVKQEQFEEKTAQQYIEAVGGLSTIEDAERMVAIHYEVLKRLPTRFDSPGRLLLLEGTVKRVLETAERLGLDLPTEIKYAMVPTGRVNAIALTHPRLSCPFILFDSQMHGFCNLFAKAWLQCIPMLEHPDHGMTLYFNPELAERKIDSEHSNGIRRLTEVLVATVEDGRPLFAEPYPPPKGIIWALEEARAGMEMFIVAHELGHHLCGHLKGEMRSEVRQIARREGLPSAHQEELEADAIGAKLSRECLLHGGVNQAFAYLGIEFLLTSMILVERFRNEINGEVDSWWNDSSSQSHPSWFHRRAVIINTVLAEIQPEIPPDTTSLIRFMERLLDMVWPRILKYSKRNNCLSMQ